MRTAPRSPFKQVSGKWRLTFALVASSAAAWAAGCSDDPPLAPPSDDLDAGAPDVAPPLPPTEAGPSELDCDSDLDDDGVWKHLECTGLYASFADKTVADDVKPYKPAAEFWSDGAEKQRWVYLPPESKIDISDWNEWRFPEGTKLWKEFKIGGKRIETRIYTKLIGGDGAWAHTTYRWNDDETDAVAKNGGESVPGLGPDGGTYVIPNSGNCDTCHFGRKDQALGFDAVSLGLPGATGETLAKLNADGWLLGEPPATELDVPGSAEAKAAIPWLSINCGACHNSNTSAAAGFTPIYFLLRAEQLSRSDGGVAAPLQELDVYAKGHCKDSNREESAGVKYKYLRGGAPARSLVSVLAGRRVPEGEEPNSSVQMPPLVTRAVDHDGLGLVDDWISTLSPCPPP